MPKKQYENSFWKVERSAQEWGDTFQANNQTTLLQSYFNKDEHYNDSFLYYLTNCQMELFQKFAFLYVHQGYNRHVKWIRSKVTPCEFQTKIETIWKLQSQKKELAKNIVVELKDFMFDEAVFHFAAYFSANLNSKKLWANKPGYQFLFKIFCDWAYNQYVTCMLSNQPLKLKWKNNETPSYSLKEHGAHSMRFREQSIDGDKSSDFRSCLTSQFENFVRIESQIHNLLVDAVDLDNDSNLTDNQGQTNEKFREIPLLLWTSIVYKNLDKKNFSPEDQQWFINSIQRHTDEIPLAVSASIIHSSLPDEIMIEDGPTINLIKWSCYMAQFIEYQFPSIFPSMDLMHDYIEKQRKIIEQLSPFEKHKSLQIIERKHLIDKLVNTFQFSTEETCFVLDSLIYSFKFDQTYDFRKRPIIELADGLLVLSMPILRAIDWHQQLAISLSDAHGQIRNDIAQYRERITNNLLTKLNFKTFENVTQILNDKVVGEIDNLVLTPNAVYLIEVKGFVSFKSYLDYLQKRIEKIESEATDQLTYIADELNKGIIKLFDQTRTIIPLPHHLPIRHFIVSNLFDYVVRTPSGIPITNLLDLSILCDSELQLSFLQILDWYFPDKTVIPHYQELFRQIEEDPCLVFTIIENGNLWQVLKEALA